MTLAMRGTVEGLTTPHPLGELLPGVYQEDAFAQRLCDALDSVLAPVIATLDCLEAYLDPELTPLDFLDWLAGWVAVTLDQNWPEERRRALVANAGELYRWHGTVKGITEHVALYTGVSPEVTDSGGAVWSPVPGGPLPGSPTFEVVVRVRVADPSTLNPNHLDAVVSAVKPAHVAHRVEILQG
jgi:phage tail-like protein